MKKEYELNKLKPAGKGPVSEHALARERARSAKMVEALRFTKREWELLYPRDYRHMAAWQKCRDAVAEYENSDD